MMRFTLALAAIALACQHGGTPAADTDEPADAAFVLPGDFSEGTTVADLLARFGAANVQLTEEPDGDGGVTPVVLLFPEDPTRRATVRYHYDDPLQTLASITVTEPTSRWRGKHGVRIGMSLAELREKNGRAFSYMGFDAGGNGRVRDAWDVGALDVTEGERLYLGVDLRLRDPGFAGARPGEYDQVSSDDPSYAALGALVEVSAILAWSSLDDEWSRAPSARPGARQTASTGNTKR
jgi:hypothetical protein